MPGWMAPARLMKCTVKVGALTDGKLGNYTCQPSNGYTYCSTKTYQVDRQQGKLKKSERHIRIEMHRFIMVEQL